MSEDVKELRPIFLYQYEWELVKKAGRKDCNHEWVYRDGRVKDDFAVVTEDGLEFQELPNGFYCSECGKVKFLPGTALDPEPAALWQQQDFHFILRR